MNQHFYFDAKKLTGRAEIEAIISERKIEDVVVESIVNGARASGSHDDGNATYVALLTLLLKLHDEIHRNTHGIHYGYGFCDEERKQLSKWMARYPAKDHHQKEAERLLEYLPAETIPIDGIIWALFRALSYTTRRR